MSKSVFQSARRFGLPACLLLAVVASGDVAFAQVGSDELTADQRAAQTKTQFLKTAKPFLGKYCLRCHNADERESGIRVDHFDGELSESTLKLWEVIAGQIADDAMPPEDELQPSDSERQAMVQWVSDALNEARSRKRDVDGSVRRLTVQQYRNTLRELLGTEEDFAAVLPPDGVSRDGFRNDANLLLTSPLQVESWFKIAEQALEACLVDPSVKPTIQNFRMDLGKAINPEPFAEKLILGANSHLLPNQDFTITQLTPDKPFALQPFGMRTKYRFNEGYAGNGTVRGWRDYNSIYHAVYACMRGDRGYPKGDPYQVVREGLLLRPSIATSEIFGESSTYGPKPNFKIALRELPESGRFRIRVTAAKYADGLLLTGKGIQPVETFSGADQISLDVTGGQKEVHLKRAGVYQIDVHPLSNAKPDETPDPSKLDQDLVGHWSFEGESPEMSVSGNLTGELQGGCKVVDSPVGSQGKAIQLDGTDDSLVIPRSPAMDVGDGDFTVAAWIKPAQLRQGGIVCLGRYSWVHGWYFDMPNNRGVLRIETVNPDNEPNGTVASRPGVIRVNQWQHVAAVVQRGKNRTHLYVNGYRVATGTVAATVLDNPAVDLHLGRIQDSQLFKGQIDEVRFYRRALAQAELEALIEPGRQFDQPLPADGPKRLAMEIGGREFASSLKNGEAAFLAVRLAEGMHQVKLHDGSDSVGRMVLTRLDDEHPVAREFTNFEGRSPSLGVYMGLRRDCGHTCQQVGNPAPVSGEDLQQYVFEGAINNYPRPFVEEGNDNYLAGVREITVRSEYTDGRDMPRMLLRSVEFEGPFYETWPPDSHRRIFHRSQHQENPANYAKDILASFASRAFRRPVRRGELDRLLQVWKSSYEQSGDFQNSIKEALVVVLTSPPFLFIVEQSEGPQSEDLEPLELASKLSYFLWNGPPDEQLIRLAEAGRLMENLDSELDRMIGHPRFRHFTDQFVQQWLGLDKLDVVETDRKQYPRLTLAVKRQLRQEPARFIEHLIKSNLPVENLIRSPFVVVNETVAGYYGLADRSDSGFEFVPLVHDQPHLGGLLSQAAVLAGLSDGKESNPVKRGAWFARKIIAEPPADPPPNVPDLKDDRNLSLRQRLQQHRNVKGCAKCHEGIDPWGLAFEQYDAGGLFRGDQIDARSRLPDGKEVRNLRDLQNYLAEERIDSVAYSVLRHLAIYAIGRSLTYNDDRLLRQDSLELKAGGYRMQDMIRAVVTSDLFLKK